MTDFAFALYRELQLTVTEVIDHGLHNVLAHGTKLHFKELLPACLEGRESWPLGYSPEVEQLTNGYHDAPALPGPMCICFCSVAMPQVRSQHGHQKRLSNGARMSTEAHRSLLGVLVIVSVMQAVKEAEQQLMAHWDIPGRGILATEPGRDFLSSELLQSSGLEGRRFPSHILPKRLQSGRWKGTIDVGVRFLFHVVKSHTQKCCTCSADIPPLIRQSTGTDRHPLCEYCIVDENFCLWADKQL